MSALASTRKRSSAGFASGPVLQARRTAQALGRTSIPSQEKLSIRWHRSARKRGGRMLMMSGGPRLELGQRHASRGDARLGKGPAAILRLERTRSSSRRDAVAKPSFSGCMPVSAGRGSDWMRLAAADSHHTGGRAQTALRSATTLTSRPRRAPPEPMRKSGRWPDRSLSR